MITSFEGVLDSYAYVLLRDYAGNSLTFYSYFLYFFQFFYLCRFHLDYARILGSLLIWLQSRPIYFNLKLKIPKI